MHRPGRGRGDGSFDYNCDGVITRNATTYCSSQSTSQAWFSDSACGSPAGSFNLCSATATVSTLTPGTGCGQPTTTTGYYFNAVPACVLGTRVTATLVGCY